MASTGKKGKKSKGVAIPLHDFLASLPNAAPAAAHPQRKPTNWADEVENDDAVETRARPVLPSAPRASRDIDDNSVPRQPPFIGYISNLPYDTEEDDIRELFADMQIDSLRLPRSDRNVEGGRLKGFGYVEFRERCDLVAAISIGDPTIKNRRVRVDVATESDGDRKRGNRERNTRENSDGLDPERATKNWRSEPSEVGGGSISISISSQNGRDTSIGEGASNKPGGWRDGPDRQSYRDKHKEYNREDRDKGWARDDKGGYKEGRNREDRYKGYSSKDHAEPKDSGSRGGFWDNREKRRFDKDDRYDNGPRRERDNGEQFRNDHDREQKDRRWGGGYKSRFRSAAGNREGLTIHDPAEGTEPRSRPRLVLAPRSLPAESVKDFPIDDEKDEDESITDTSRSTSTDDFFQCSAGNSVTEILQPKANIFGSAKPVDTASRDIKIYERLKAEEEDIKRSTEIEDLRFSRSREISRTTEVCAWRTEARTSYTSLPLPENESQHAMARSSNWRPENHTSRPRDRPSRTNDDRMIKLKEPTAPNFVASNQFASLDDTNFTD